MSISWTDLLTSSQKPGVGRGNNSAIANLLLQQSTDGSPIQSPVQGLAKLAQAYVAKSLMEKDQAQQQAGNTALASALAPEKVETTGGGPSAPLPIGGGQSIDYAPPEISRDVNTDKRAQLATLLNTGALTPQSVAPQLMQSLGIGPERAPIKGSPGDVFYDPATHAPIPGMSVPVKPDKPEATPDILQIAQSLFPNDPKAQHDYVVKNSPSNIRSITNEAPKHSWQILTDPSNNTQYRYDLDSGQALTLDGKPYAPGGAGKINSGAVRSPASLAAQRYLQEHPDATAEDLTKFAADYGKTVKSTSAFGTGKQGDLIRSFNVGISHLNTLGGLVDALGNGDIQAFNKLGNAYSQQTGSPAPTNFDAAKAIVGDEIIKAIVGGGGALADRENAQNQINRANSPQQLRGVIQTYKGLMAGQLKGLAKQYTDTTGLNDFNSRLAPETIKELETEQPGGAPASADTDALLKKYGVTK